MRQIKVSSNSAKLFNKGDRVLLGSSPPNQEKVVVVNATVNTLTIRQYNKFDYFFDFYWTPFIQWLRDIRDLLVEDDVEGYYDEDLD